jgi:hypothetical protein
VICTDANSSLTVRVDRIGNKYIWQLYRQGIVEKVKYSGHFQPGHRNCFPVKLVCARCSLTPRLVALNFDALVSE